MNWDWYQLIQWMRMDSDLNLVSFRRMMSWHRSFFQIMKSYLWKDRNIDILFNVLSVVTLITLHKNHSNCYFNHSFQSVVLNTYYTHSFTLTNRNEINDLLLITHSSNTFYSFQQILISPSTIHIEWKYLNDKTISQYHHLRKHNSNSLYFCMSKYFWSNNTRNNKLSPYLD